MKMLRGFVLMFLISPAYALSFHVDGPGTVTFTPDIPIPAPSPTPTPAPTPPPVQSGALPFGAVLTKNFMELSGDFYSSTRLGNSNATDDQKAWIEILLASPFTHNVTLDFYAMINVDPETPAWNCKFPVRAYGHTLTPKANDYIGHTVTAGAMQFTEENPTKTYGYFDILKTPGVLVHYVAKWDYDAKTFSLKENGLAPHVWTNVNFGANDRIDFNIQLVLANTKDSNPGVPRGSYFKVRSDIKMTGN